MAEDLLSRPAASAAVDALGWRVVLGSLAASVPVGSLQQGLEVAAAAIAAGGDDADDHLRVDVRADRVELVLKTRARGGVTGRDTELARDITAAIQGLGRSIARPAGTARPVQLLEIAVDALDIPAVRPFWQAVLGLADEVGPDGPTDGLVDPAGQLPTVWFQQMDQPRPQRNRIHFDITVAHDEADGRVAAALAAGGVLVSDDAARAFWILADVEGNEVCVCTWQDRDPS